MKRAFSVAAMVDSIPGALPQAGMRRRLWREIPHPSPLLARLRRTESRQPLEIPREEVSVSFSISTEATDQRPSKNRCQKALGKAERKITLESND